MIGLREVGHIERDRQIQHAVEVEQGRSMRDAAKRIN